MKNEDIPHDTFRAHNWLEMLGFAGRGHLEAHWAVIGILRDLEYLHHSQSQFRDDAVPVKCFLSNFLRKVASKYFLAIHNASVAASSRARTGPAFIHLLSTPDMTEQSESPKNGG